MSELQSIGQFGICERGIYFLELNEPHLPAFDLPSRHFACLLVAEFSAEAAPLIQSLMSRGAAYITAWGPRCALVADTIYARNRPVPWHVMASWHENDPLDEAIWFLLNSAFPDDEVFERCKSGLALVVGHPGLAGDVRRLLVEARAA